MHHRTDRRRTCISGAPGRTGRNGMRMHFSKKCSQNAVKTRFEPINGCIERCIYNFIIVVYFYAYTDAICKPHAQTGSMPIRLICKLKPPKTQCFRGFGVPGAIRTRGVPLRRRKQGFPPIPLECPQTLAITAFLTNSIVPVSSKKHLFYPSAIRQRLDKLIGDGRTFSHSVRQN